MPFDVPWFEITYSVAAATWIRYIFGPAIQALVRGERVKRIPGDW